MCRQMQDIHIFNQWTGQWWTQQNKARCVGICVYACANILAAQDVPFNHKFPWLINDSFYSTASPCFSAKEKYSYFSTTVPEPITRSSAHRFSPSPQPRLERISQPVGFTQTSTAWLRHSFTPKWLHDIQASKDRKAQCPGAPTCQSRSLKSAAGLGARHHRGPEQRSGAGSIKAATPEVGFKLRLPAVHVKGVRDLQSLASASANVEEMQSAHQPVLGIPSANRAPQLDHWGVFFSSTVFPNSDLRISCSTSFLQVKAKLAGKLPLQAALQKAAEEDEDGSAGKA